MYNYKYVAVCVSHARGGLLWSQYILYGASPSYFTLTYESLLANSLFADYVIHLSHSVLCIQSSLSNPKYTWINLYNHTSYCDHCRSFSANSWYHQYHCFCGWLLHSPRGVLSKPDVVMRVSGNCIHTASSSFHCSAY